MYDSTIAVRGTIITDPHTRRVGDDQAFGFRVAANSRYLDRSSGEWRNGSTLYFSATCWGDLGRRAAGTLFKGDHIIVQGRLATNEYERDGTLQRDLEMRVTAIGPDLARMDVQVKRRPRPEEQAEATAGEQAPTDVSGLAEVPADAGNAPWEDDDEPGADAGEVTGSGADADLAHAAR